MPEPRRIEVTSIASLSEAKFPPTGAGNQRRKGADVFPPEILQGIVPLSGREGFSITAFEAMYGGLPVVTPDLERNAFNDYVKDAGIVCSNDIECANEIAERFLPKSHPGKYSESATEHASKFLPE